MVVLDFWATWCGPCRLALPRLQKFRDWARAADLAIEVFPVNIAERLPTAEAKRAHVEKYWTRQGYTMDTLMDYDNSAATAFEIGPIPHSVVVGPDGTIAHIEVGFKPDFAERLKRMARELGISPKETP
jgi:thiol-disulfide isomerase/thioredoxin